MRGLGKAAWWLVVLSAVNLGLINVVSVDVVSSILRSVPGATQAWGILVGVAGVYCLVGALGKK